MGKGSWGVEIAGRALNCVRLEKKGGSLKITDVEVIGFPRNLNLTNGTCDRASQISQAIIKFKTTNKLKSDTIVSSLPSQSTFNRLLKLPPVESEKLEVIISHEVKSQLPFDVQDILWDYQMVERLYEPAEEKEVIVFAVKKDIVNELLTIFQGSKFSCDILQFSPLGIYNFLIKDKQIENSGIVIDMEEDKTDLIIINGPRIWIRSIPITGSDFTKAIASSFDISIEEAEKIKINPTNLSTSAKISSSVDPLLKNFVGEVYRSLGWYKSTWDTKFDDVILIGSATRMVNFQKVVSSSLEINSRYISKINTIELEKDIDADSFNSYLPQLSAAIGLAIQGLGESKNKVNILPSSYLEGRKVAKKKPFVVATICLLYLFVILGYRNQKKDIEETKRVLVKAKSCEEEYLKVKEDFNNKIAAIGEEEKPLIGISSIGKGRNLVVGFLNTLNSVFEDNNLNKDEDKKLWVVKLNIVLAEETKIRVGLECVVRRRKEEKEEAEFIKKKFNVISSKYKIAEEGGIIPVLDGYSPSLDYENKTKDNEGMFSFYKVLFTIVGFNKG